MELISKEELIKKMYHESFEVESELQRWDSGCWIRYMLFENIIDKMPTIESRPKGKWIGGTTDCFQCSNCKELSFYPRYVKVTEVEWNFCPYCGADMGGNE